MTDRKKALDRLLVAAEDAASRLDWGRANAKGCDLRDALLNYRLASRPAPFGEAEVTLFVCEKLGEAIVALNAAQRDAHKLAIELISRAKRLAGYNEQLELAAGLVAAAEKAVEWLRYCAHPAGDRPAWLRTAMYAHALVADELRAAIDAAKGTK